MAAPISVTSALVALVLAACGDDGGMNQMADAAVDAVLVEVCTGGTDEDGDTFTDCDDDDCWEDAACYHVDDDVDFPDGDPALDYDKIRATLAGGTATFFATFEGAWPPPTSYFSWYVLFEIDNDGNTPVGRVTLLMESGAITILTADGIALANTTVRQVPRGLWVRFTGVDPVGEKYYMESRIQKVMGGMAYSDTVVSAPAPLP